MKKLFAIMISLLIVASFAACGCMRSTTGESTVPSSTTNTPSTMPDIIPTMETNIPDPSVDTEMPIYTDGTDQTDNTITSSNTEADK